MTESDSADGDSTGEESETIAYGDRTNMFVERALNYNPAMAMYFAHVLNNATAIPEDLTENDVTLTVSKATVPSWVPNPIRSRLQSVVDSVFGEIEVTGLINSSISFGAFWEAEEPNPELRRERSYQAAGLVMDEFANLKTREDLAAVIEQGMRFGERETDKYDGENDA